MIYRTPAPGPSHETQPTEPEPSEDDTPRQNPPAEHLPLFTADEPLDVQCPDSPSPSRHPLPELIGDAEELAESSQGSAAMGRTPATVNTILEAQFEEFHLQFTQLASSVGMPVAQVVSRFSKLFSRTNTGNEWNEYQRYHIAHRAQELGRLGEDDVITATPSKSVVE